MPSNGTIIYDSKPPIDLGDIFPDATQNEVALLSACLKYQDRPSCSSLLHEPYFSEYPPKLAKLIPEDKRIKVAIKKYDDIFNVH